MRLLLPLLSLCALFVPSLAAPKETKLQRITSLATKARGPIALNDKSFEDITSEPRNYTTIILLTALDPRFGCHLCREFQPDFELLTKSWLKQNPTSDGLFFSYLDFQTGRATFQKLGLTSAPILYLYPPTYGPHAKAEHEQVPLRYEFLPTPLQAEALSAWITRHTQYSVTVKRPVDYVRYFTLGAALVFALTATKVAFPYIMPVLGHPTLWAALSLVLILLFTSGHMFNHIRKTPYVVQSPNGGVSYIAAGFSNQFGMESQIIGVVYAFLSFGAISLAMKIPRMTDPSRQKAAVMMWNVFILCLFSFLMNIFKVKNPGYPFKLPPVMG